MAFCPMVHAIVGICARPSGGGHSPRVMNHSQAELTARRLLAAGCLVDRRVRPGAVRLSTVVTESSRPGRVPVIPGSSLMAGRLSIVVTGKRARPTPGCLRIAVSSAIAVWSSIVVTESVRAEARLPGNDRIEPDGFRSSVVVTGSSRGRRWLPCRSRGRARRGPVEHLVTGKKPAPR
jgi:hypothetical protein